MAAEAPEHPPPAPLPAPATAAPGELEGLPWAYRSGRYLAVAHDFGVRTTDGALGRHLDRLFAGFRASGRPAAWYSVFDRGPRADRRFAVYYGDRRVVLARSPGRALRWLLALVNRQVVAGSAHCTLVHAAGAEWNGVGVLLPAPMESGKTTLVAGLLRAGLRYLTDEAVAFDPASGRVHPFAKPLTVGRGSWGVLADLEPQAEPGLGPWLDGQWQLPPDAIRPAPIAPPTYPRLVISPRYDPSARTELTPISRAQGLRLLVQHTFGFTDDPLRHLDTLAAAVRRCTCYRLTLSDLRTACDLVLSLLEGVGGSGERRAPAHRPEPA